MHLGGSNDNYWAMQTSDFCFMNNGNYSDIQILCNMLTETDTSIFGK